MLPQRTETPAAENDQTGQSFPGSAINAAPAAMPMRLDGFRSRLAALVAHLVAGLVLAARRGREPGSVANPAAADRAELGW